MNEEQNIKKTIKRNRKNSIFSNILLVLLIIFAILSVGILMFLESESFRKPIIGKIQNIVNNSINANVAIGDIDFASEYGIEMKNLALYINTDTLATAENIIIDINILSLLENRISINNFVIENGGFNIRKYKNGITNTSLIAKPTEEKDKEETETNLKFEVGTLKLNNCYFSLYDSTQTTKPDSLFDTAHMNFTEINFNAEAKINLGKNVMDYVINRLDAKENRSHINLRKFSGKAHLGADIFRVEDISIKTDDSEFILSAIIEAGVLGDDTTRTFTNSKYIANLDAKKVSFSDVKKFAPIPIDILGENNIKMNAEGYLNDTIWANIEFKNKSLDMAMHRGFVANILDMPNFAYGGNIYLDGESRDIPQIFTFLDTDALPNLSKFQLEVEELHGNIDSAGAVLNLKSKYGILIGESGFKFSGTPSYYADLDFKKLNLNRILGRKNISDSLTGSIYAKGYSFSPNEITGKFDIILRNSNIQKFEINNIDLSVNAEKGKFSIDTLQMNIANPKYGIPMQMEINGALDYSNTKKPKYNIGLKVRDADLEYALDNPAFPEIFTFDLDISGERFDIDNLTTKLNLEIEQLTFWDKSLFPFDISINVNQSDSVRTAELKSSFVEAKLKGDYSISRISKYFSTLLEVGMNDIEKYATILQGKSDSLLVELNGKELPDLDCNLELTVNDISSFSSFWQGKEIDLESNIDIHLISSESNSRIVFDDFMIDKIYYSDGEQNIHIKNIDLDFDVSLSLGSLGFAVDNAYFKLDIPKPFVLNQDSISLKILDFSIVNNIMQLNINAGYNDLAECRLNSQIEFNNESVDFIGDTIAVQLGEKFFWQNTVPSKIRYANNIFDIGYFDLLGKNEGHLEITGKMNTSHFNEMTVQLTDFNFDTFKENYKELNQYPIDKINQAKLNIVAKADGEIKNPNASVRISSSDIFIDEIKAGKLDVNFAINNQIFQGYFKLIQKENKMLHLSINRIPIEALVVSKPVDNQIDLSLIINHLDLSPYSSIIPQIGDLTGYIKSNINLSGGMPNDLNYAGFFSIPKANFTLQPTNMSYTCNMDLNFQDHIFELKKLEVNNLSNLNGGKINLGGGWVLSDELKIEEIDIDINAKDFKVLSDASKAVLPSIYGDLKFSTVNGMNFSGNLERPVLTGGIALVNSNLNMARSQGKRNVESKLQYQMKDDGENLTVNFYDENHNKEELDSITVRKIQASSSNFFKNLAMDIEFYIRGKSSLTMDLGSVGDMYAEVTESDNQPIDFNKKYHEDLGQVYGRLTLSDKSTLKTFKLLNISGFIDFPTHSPLDPELNVKAVYSGNMTSDGSRKNYEVIIELTGTVDNIQNEIYYTLQNEKPLGDKSQIQQDALMLLLTGQLYGNQQDQESTNNILQSGTSALLSAFASKSLNGVLKGNYISSAGIDFKGESFEEATIQLSGQLPGNITWTFGGDITDISGARKITIELPIYTLIENEKLRNVFLQASWNENSQNTEMDDDETDWDVQLKYNKSW